MNILPPSGFELPAAKTVIWRYFALEKFLDFLIHERLHLANVNSLSDKYEATVPSTNIVRRRSSLEQSGLIGRDLDEAMASYQWSLNSLRSGTLVNCWSAAPEESYALWRIYLADSRAGVAIRTTVGRLKDGIVRGNDPYPDNLYLGRVRYADHINDGEPSRFSVIYTKKKYYQFEQEIRLSVLEYHRSEGGVERPYRIDEGRNVQVDLETVIEQIVLSPFAGPWFRQSFKTIVARIAPNLVERIVHSNIRDQ